MGAAKSVSRSAVECRMSQFSDWMSWSSSLTEASAVSTTLSDLSPLKPSQDDHICGSNKSIANSSDIFSSFTSRDSEHVSENRSAVGSTRKLSRSLSTELSVTLSSDVPHAKPSTSVAKEGNEPTHRWGITPTGKPVIPKETSLREPCLIHLHRDKTALPQFCISIVTNTMRNQALLFSRIVRTCQENSHQMSHSLIDDIYVFLDVALTCELDCIDTLMNTVIPFAENLSSMKGSLQLRERTVLCKWSKMAADEMRKSQSKFKRNLPAGEQLGFLVHAALGFQFMLDIASLADRFLPGHMQAADVGSLRKLVCDVFNNLSLTRTAGLEPGMRIWAIVGWMSDRERRAFRHFATRRLKRGSLSNAAIRVAKSHSREYDEFPKTVEKNLVPCGGREQLRGSGLASIFSPLMMALKKIRRKTNEEAMEFDSTSSERIRDREMAKLRLDGDIVGDNSSAPFTGNAGCGPNTAYVIDSVYELDGWEMSSWDT